MTFPADWQQLAAASAVLVVAWGAMIFVIHALMSRFFASRATMTMLEGRIGKLEHVIASLPTHADMHDVKSQMTTLTSSASGLTATLIGIKHVVDLLLKHQLEQQGH